MPQPESISVDETKYIREDLATRNRSDYNESYDPIVGNQYVIETPTKYWIGTLAAETDHHYVFVNAAWMPDSGKFSKFCDGSRPNELEPLSSDSPLRISKGAECVMYPHEIKIETI